MRSDTSTRSKFAFLIGVIGVLFATTVLYTTKKLSDAQQLQQFAEETLAIQPLDVDDEASSGTAVAAARPLHTAAQQRPINDASASHTSRQPSSQPAKSNSVVGEQLHRDLDGVDEGRLASPNLNTGLETSAAGITETRITWTVPANGGNDDPSNYQNTIEKSSANRNGTVAETAADNDDDEEDEAEDMLARQWRSVQKYSHKPEQHLRGGARYAPFVPKRNQGRKDLAQKCVQAGEGGIFFKHFRKAGGTTVGKSIRNAACRRYCDVPKPMYGSEFPYLNPQVFAKTGMLNSTIFLTSLRHPVDRIVSMYWFEGRWPRICGLPCERKREKTNRTKTADLCEWVDHVHAQTDFRRLRYTRHNQCGQWTSVENYYIRTLLGVDSARNGEEKKLTPYGRGFLNITLTRRHLDQAKKILDNFDLIMIQEQMRQPSNMTRMLHAIIGSATDDPYRMGVHRKGDERHSESYVNPTDVELEKLRQLNELDIELYEYAVELSARTVERWLAKSERASYKQELEEFDAAQSCNRPDILPSRDIIKTTIGGRGCNTHGAFFYYSGDCMLHSRVPNYS